MTYILSFAGISDLLKANGYQLFENPPEQRPPGSIQLEYKMDVRVEDVNCASYFIYNEVTVSCTYQDARIINEKTIALMNVIGTEFVNQYHFEMGRFKIQVGNGTMRMVTFSVMWRQFLTLGVGLIT